MCLIDCESRLRVQNVEKVHLNRMQYINLNAACSLE